MYIPQHLFFGTTNAKLAKSGIATFAIPSGLTCPGACGCKAWVDKRSRKLVDGPKQKYRCYQASQEVFQPSLFKSAWNNLNALRRARTVEAMADLIESSLPAKHWGIIRVHAGGDFYSLDYMLAWFEAARRDPKRVFYAYTKSIPFWLKTESMRPNNFHMVASMDGKYDHLVEKHDLRRAHVVFSPEEAEERGLSTDRDDSHALNPFCREFAHLVHGVQPPNTEASRAVKDLKARDIKFSYPRTGKVRQRTTK